MGTGPINYMTFAMTELLLLDCLMQFPRTVTTDDNVMVLRADWQWGQPFPQQSDNSFYNKVIKMTLVIARSNWFEVCLELTTFCVFGVKRSLFS